MVLYFSALNFFNYSCVAQLTSIVTDEKIDRAGRPTQREFMLIFDSSSYKNRQKCQMSIVYEEAENQDYSVHNECLACMLYFNMLKLCLLPCIHSVVGNCYD